jgi:hypothetical protein
MFFGLPNLDPEVQGTDPDPFHQERIVRKTLIPIGL